MLESVYGGWDPIFYRFTKKVMIPQVVAIMNSAT